MFGLRFQDIAFLSMYVDLAFLIIGVPFTIFTSAPPLWARVTVGIGSVGLVATTISLVGWVVVDSHARGVI